MSIAVIKKQTPESFYHCNIFISDFTRLKGKRKINIFSWQNLSETFRFFNKDKTLNADNEDNLSA